MEGEEGESEIFLYVQKKGYWNAVILGKVIEYSMTSFYQIPYRVKNIFLLLLSPWDHVQWDWPVSKEVI